ncbi:MAG: carboxypeptidase M32 [Thermoplasmatota archaeon]
MSTYEDLIKYSKKLRNIENAIYLLAWDERTYMPKGAVDGRSKTKAELSQMYHEKMTSDKMKKMIDELNKRSVNDSLDDIQRAAVREMTRGFDRRYKIPDELIREIAVTSSKGQSAWDVAKEKSDFDHFLPYLKKHVELQQEKAGYIGYENEPYDALIDGYEPGFTAKKIKNIFDPMKKKLSNFVDSIIDSSKIIGEGVFEGKSFDIEKQKILSEEIAKDFGYDFEHGRLDETTHPFTMGMDDDVRITNRYDDSNLSSLYSLMHETGHALYEQGLPEEWYGHPLGKRISMGYHESQSRMWENFVGRSEEFMDYLYPKLVKSFPSLKEHTKQEFYEAINQVKPSFIRVDADEVTYNLHIALRFDIELGFFRDEIEAGEADVVWQNKMDEYLGIVPEDPAEGVLQDIHWSSSQFGYFPSYALGNLYASQIFDTALEGISTLPKDISGGRFNSLREWLRDEIHSHGRRYLAEEMTNKLTGETLSEDYYLTYLKEKYSPIYEL